MTNEDLDYWQGVLEGTRELDPAGGCDIEELAELLIEDLRAARKTLDRCRALFREWRGGQWCPYGRIVAGFAEALDESPTGAPCA